MAESTTRPEFAALVLRSGLVTAEQLAAARAAVGERGAAQGDAGDRALADALVQGGLLTRFQAEQLLDGRWKFQLGPYLIFDSLGEGGMGQVLKAEHRIMGRVVALKILPRHKTTRETVARFSREIRAQAQLDHPNLVRALDAGHEPRRAASGRDDDPADEDSGVRYRYLVTELVPGSDLRRIVRRTGRLPMGGAAWVITQVARGLDYAHGRGLLHRDIKPGNVLVQPDGKAKLLDLGLVGYFGTDAVDELSVGRIVGTADYISPEQVRTPEQVGPASDIYSLGCTLYYAVTGKVPFPGGTTREKIRAQLERLPLWPRRLNPALSDAFVDVLAGMLEKDPQQRIATAAEVIDRLAPWVDETWRPSLDTDATTLAAAPPPPPAAEAGEPEERAEPDPSCALPLSATPSVAEHWSDVSQQTDPLSAATDDTVRLTTRPPVPPPLPPAAPWRQVHWGTAALLLLMLVGSSVAAAVLWQVLMSLL